MLKTIFFSPILQKARWEAWRMRVCCGKVQSTQQVVLREKLSYNGNSRMGREIGASACDSVEAFRSRIPVTNYDYYADSIEKCKAGDSLAMVGNRQRIVMFALSSGTTGKPKYIPITKKFLQEYRRGWLAWGFHAYHGNNMLVERMLLPITSPSVEFTTPAGIPCGAISGLTIDSQSWITQHLFAVPRDVYQIKDSRTKYYVLGRLALEKQVGSISSANPSTVLGVFRLLNECREQMVLDIEKGALDGAPNLALEERNRLAPLLKPNPSRAAELRLLIDKYGALYPKHFWKDFSLVSNWKGGSLGRYLDFYPEFFGNAEVRDIGLVASEGRMTIPISADGSDGVLDIQSHFYEFIPEEAIEDKAPKTFLAHELEKGKRYFILLTTSSGFYRYDIRDLVEVTGFYLQAPMLRFLSKGKHFSSITGEKLSEYQVVEAVNTIARRFGVRLENYCLFPKWGSLPYYGLLVEEGSLGEKNQWGNFVRDLDAELRGLNCEYKAKRESGRLGAISLVFSPAGTFDAWKAEKLRDQGGREEQYKHVFLSSEEGLDKKCHVVREFLVKDYASIQAS